MIVLALVGLLAASPSPVGPVQAVEMPDFDVPAHCEAVASFGGTRSAMMFGACFEQEQKAYDALKGRWPGLPAQLRAHCEQVASFGTPGSFTMLKACVEMEEQAARKNPQRRFQR